MKVVVPTHITEKQKKLLEDFESESMETTNSTKKKTQSSPAVEHQSVLNEAWKRLKSFLGKSERSSEDSTEETSNKSKAKI